MGRFREEGIRYVTKRVGVVEISDPTAVETRLQTIGGAYSKGMIYCSCPELGFEGNNLIPCRYGLSIPYYKVKDGDRVWIEPTIGKTERWVYSGFVDCGDREDLVPETEKQMLIHNEDGSFEIKLGTMLITLDSVNKLITIDSNGDGKAKIDVNFATEDEEVITINAGIGKMIWNKDGLKMQDGDEPFVLGNVAQAELQKIVDQLTQLSTDFTSWVVAPTDGGAALKAVLLSGFLTKPPADVSSILSEEIKGK